MALKSLFDYLTGRSVFCLIRVISRIVPSEVIRTHNAHT
jgi:hypothetical protein